MSPRTPSGGPLETGTHLCSLPLPQVGGDLVDGDVKLLSDGASGATVDLEESNHQLMYARDGEESDDQDGALGGQVTHKTLLLLLPPLRMPLPPLLMPLPPWMPPLRMPLPCHSINHL